MYKTLWQAVAGGGYVMCAVFVLRNPEKTLLQGTGRAGSIQDEDAPDKFVLNELLLL